MGQTSRKSPVCPCAQPRGPTQTDTPTPFEKQKKNNNMNRAMYHIKSPSGLFVARI